MTFIKFFMRLMLGEFFRCSFGGGGGSSSSRTDTITNNIDKRIAVGDGGLGVSADHSSVAVNITDGGIVSRALDSIDKSRQIDATGYSKLLDTASNMFNKSEGLIGQTQKAVADAYATAQLQEKGAIDNKTIIVLAVAGAAAAVMIARK